ncbi:hypothetical protein VPH35_025820 [Triticum aestivum]
MHLEADFRDTEFDDQRQDMTKEQKRFSLDNCLNIMIRGRFSSTTSQEQKKSFLLSCSVRIVHTITQEQCFKLISPLLQSIPEETAPTAISFCRNLLLPT